MGGPDMGGLILLGACNGGPGIVRNVPNPAPNLSTELTDGRPATGKRHGNLICRCVSLPTPRPFWLEYR